MDIILNHLPLLGRVLVGVFFVFFGFWNIMHWQPTLNAMRQKSIPLASLLLAAGIVLQTLCGLMLIVGIYAKLAALLLIPFTVIAVFMFHAFWTFTGEARRLNIAIFVTHLTCTTGALILLMNTIESNADTMALLMR